MAGEPARAENAGGGEAGLLGGRRQSLRRGDQQPLGDRSRRLGGRWVVDRRLRLLPCSGQACGRGRFSSAARSLWAAVRDGACPGADRWRTASVHGRPDASAATVAKCVVPERWTVFRGARAASRAVRPGAASRGHGTAAVPAAPGLKGCGKEQRCRTVKAVDASQPDGRSCAGGR